MTSVLCFGFALLLSPFAQGVLGEGDPAKTEQIDRGGLLFRIHCLNCHGSDGRGTGPMAKPLASRPADLTKISRRAGGEFPTQEIRETIDGRAEVRGRGAREMPIWGLSFRQTERDSAQEEEIRTRIEDLIAYIETIQRPAN